ncbi:KH homology domain-containing protein 4-like isoform X3 [Hylaeus anthracinus]|uniref:KH homology domain-containing protein 4-like isoform X3 n=1 Tax=Hylaeus anthracinus TaxID=313031 RepID=UPI0023BA02ED|nr:KH homology domain-containing protein 4-like isoform X3 [Hylaeus anthracinus]
MTKGKLRGSDSNNKLTASNATFKNGETYTSEFEINEIPPSARTLLTKGYIQDEINSYSGATVSTRGRFMTDQEKLQYPNERSLYLYIQGHSKHNIDLAIQKINEIIKTEHQSSLNRPSRFTNAPPPLMSLHSGVTSVEKICVGIENAPEGFDLRGRIIGAGGANLLYIRGETGANVTLRGRGSQFIHPASGTESPEPLHLYIEHPKPEALQNAKQLAINLIQTMQSELQLYIQQQPPPVQSQQVIEQSQIQQNIIQHPQSSVVTLPATILTATVAGAPGSGITVPPPGVHIPPHSGPLVPPPQAQEIQTFMQPPPVGQVQLIGPPSTVSQVQYQIHPGQPLQIQGLQPGSQSSPQPVAQMYVMSQPPPQSPAQQNFITSSSAPVSGAVSYVYTQPNIQRPSTPPQGIIETVNVNLQQPPPTAPINITQQPPPPLLHLHFPPPNFPPNQPPPPVPQTYQIQYQQVQAPVSQSQTQFVLQPGDHIVPPQLQQNHEQSQAVAQHMLPPQFEGHTPQFHLQVPPPSTQTFLVPNAQSPQHHLPPGAEIQQQQEGPMDQGSQPQPVPPPQIVPPPSAGQMPNSMNVLTSIPPPTQAPPPQNAPWLYQTQQPQQMMQSQGQLQVQMPPGNIPLHNVPPPQVQAQIQYHAQHMQYQNGHMPPQVHYTVQPPHQQFDQKPDSPEQKSHGVKRRFSDVEANSEAPPYQCGPLPAQRHGTGEGDRQQQVLHGPSPTAAGLPHGDRNKLLMPPPHTGEKRSLDQKSAGISSVNEPNPIGDSINIHPGGGPSLPPPLPPQAPWQTHHVRAPWGRPPPMPRDADHQGVCPVLPPTNMPPPQIRPRGHVEGNRSPVQNAILEHPLNVEYNQMPPYTTKPPPYNSHPLMQSICNPPPPPPPHHQQRPQHPQTMQHYQVPISQTYQPPTSCPPWMN